MPGLAAWTRPRLAGSRLDTSRLLCSCPFRTRLGCYAGRPLVIPAHTFMQLALRGLGAVVVPSPPTHVRWLPREPSRRRARAESTGPAWLPGAQQPVAPDGQARFWLPRGASDPQVNQVLGARPLRSSRSRRLSWSGTLPPRSARGAVADLSTAGRHTHATRANLQFRGFTRVTILHIAAKVGGALARSCIPLGRSTWALPPARRPTYSLSERSSARISMRIRPSMFLPVPSPPSPQ